MCGYCKVYKTNYSDALMEAKYEYTIPYAEVYIVKAIKDYKECGYNLRKGQYYLAISAEDYGLHEIYYCPNCGRKLGD